MKPSIEILVPFQIGPDGGVATTTDPVVQATQHIVTIVGTVIGERPIRGDYGSPAMGLWFEANDTLVLADYAARIQDAIASYEPAVETVSVQSLPYDVDSGIAEFRVSFRLWGTDEEHHAEIAVGGTVTETTFMR